MVSPVLAAKWGLALSWCKPMTTDLRKGKVIIRNSQLFRNALYCNSSVSSNEYINWIHHFRCDHHCGPVWSFFILNIISTFFKQLSPFINIFFAKTCFSIHIIHSCVNFTLFELLFSATKNLMTDQCSSLEHSVLFTTILNSLKMNIFCKIKIIFILNQFQIKQGDVLVV